MNSDCILRNGFKSYERKVFSVAFGVKHSSPEKLRFDVKRAINGLTD